MEIILIGHVPLVQLLVSELALVLTTRMEQIKVFTSFKAPHFDLRIFEGALYWVR